MSRSVSVVFGKALPQGLASDVLITPRAYRPEASAAEWRALEEFVGPGSVQEGGAMVRSLPALTTPDGTRVPKAVLYQGYELWWLHMTELFLYFTLPYTQYRQLLEHLAAFDRIDLYDPPYEGLFRCYLETRGRTLVVHRAARFTTRSGFSLGIAVQILLTLVSVPVLMLLRRKRMVFTGDKFEKDRDYDFRMRFIYEELRGRGLPFVEFIRSPASWRTVLAHAFVRKRPVVYAEAVAYVARLLSIVTFSRARAERAFGRCVWEGEPDPEKRFLLAVATQYLRTAPDDIWAIRIMRAILRAIGVKGAIMVAASDRNWATVLAAKALGIPTLGILHGVNTHHYNLYDFLPGFDGEKMLSVDRYGLWSDWWKQYYLECGNAYKPGQLAVSGPMRPLTVPVAPARAAAGRIRVLFISEQVAAPLEVLPYLTTLLAHPEFDLTIKFRPFRDGFEEWLKEHEPQLLAAARTVRGSSEEAIRACDAVIGTHSTAVLEALFQYKVPLFFDTRKWGDYFSLGAYGHEHPFFARGPEELIERVRGVRGVPQAAVAELRGRFFGDPTQNGSQWVVNELERLLAERSSPPRSRQG